LRREALVTAMLGRWHAALAQLDGPSPSGLMPTARRAGLTVSNCLTLSEKDRQVLLEALASSERLATEREAPALLALRLDAQAKLNCLCRRVKRMQGGPSATRRNARR
jgi:hypothetical protein